MADDDRSSFRADLELLDGFRFRVTFDDGDSEVVMDEPAPLGGGSGPNATRLLGAAVGNCLSASLLFCLQKAHADVKGIRTSVEGSLARDEGGRLRIDGLTVRIRPTIGGDEKRIRRCLDLFEGYCTVTESVRRGIDVDVRIESPVGEDSGAGTATGSPRPLAETPS